VSDTNNSPESGLNDESEDVETPGPDEAYCADCGEVIKKEAEVCPECGVRQKPPESSTDQQQQSTQQATVGHRQRELEKIASQDKTAVMLMSFFLTPVGYWMIGKTGLALINFFTFNYFLFGPLIVPIHCHKIMEDAKDDLHRSGVQGY
jgi:hypothetical protein